jgi:hypothetical protein
MVRTASKTRRIQTHSLSRIPFQSGRNAGNTCSSGSTPTRLIDKNAVLFRILTAASRRRQYSVQSTQMGIRAEIRMKIRQLTMSAGSTAFRPLRNERIKYGVK